MYNLHLSPEQKQIRETVREFVAREVKPIALERDRIEDFDRRFPWEVLDKASQLGLRTMALSPEHGGAGADNLTCCIVAEELAVGDVGVAATISQTATLARVWFERVMTREQRERFLPQFLADHRFHLAFAGHEPDTDLGWRYHRPPVPGATYRTTAVRQRDGDWVINGVKNFITNAPIAKLIAVQARTISRTGESGVSTLLVPRETPGLSIREHDKVGRRLGSNGEIVFQDCRVPAENLLGEEGKSPFLGGAAALGRRIPRFQAMNLGIGRAAYEAALEYAKLRVQGGRPIIEHQAVGLALADMAIRLEVARTMIWHVAWASDHPEAYADGSLPDLPLQIMTKVFVSEAVQQVCLEAAQIFGGMGVMRELPAQKYVRDALIFLHSESTNSVARLRIAEALAGYRRSASLAGE